MRQLAGTKIAALIVTILGAIGNTLIGPSAAASPRAAADGEIPAIRQTVTDGTSTCGHLIADHLSRITAQDRRLHSVIALNPDAMAQALRIDRLPTKAKRSLPLLCVPLLVKDNIDVAGMATTLGSDVLRGNMATHDAAAVAMLRRAGAIVLAKTNMSEFAFNYRGLSSVRGQTYSPFSMAESAGGSSSGNAAALGAGIGVVALGTDTSGSLRVPAALTGRVGMRPTFGLLPLEGVAPLSPTQDVIGPMCRHVADCAAVMAVLTPWRLQDPLAAEPLKGLRVGILSGLMRPAGAEEQAALAVLREAGAELVETRLRDEPVLVGREPPAGETAQFASRSTFDFPAVMDTYLPSRPNAPKNAMLLLSALEQSAAAGRTDQRVVTDVRKFIANRDGAATDPRARVNGRFRDEYVRERLDEAFNCRPGGLCVDILVYASVQDIGAPVDKGPETGGTHRLAAYSGRPAIAFPVAVAMTASGPRPVSVEIIGSPGDEYRLLAIVSDWQKRLGSVQSCTHCFVSPF